MLEVAQPRKRNVGTNVRERADRWHSKLLPVATDIEFDGPPPSTLASLKSYQIFKSDQMCASSP